MAGVAKWANVVAEGDADRGNPSTTSEALKQFKFLRTEGTEPNSKGTLAKQHVVHTIASSRRTFAKEHESREDANYELLCIQSKHTKALIELK